jgi:hypothetical protein
MSRSDSRQAPPGGHRPQTGPAPQSAHLHGDYDLAGWTQGLGGAPLPNPKPQQPAPQGYPAQQPYAAQPPAQPYGQPDPGYTNYNWGAGQEPPATPHFDPYTPPTTPSRRPAPAPAPAPAKGYSPQPPATAYSPPQAEGYGNGYGGYQADPAAALRGAQYDQWAAAPAPIPNPPPAPALGADPRGYDLASYMPPQGRAQPPQPDYGSLTADLATHPHPGHPQPGYSDWGHQSGYEQAPQGYDAAGYAQQGYAPQGYAAQGHAQQNYAQPGYDQQGYADPNAQGYEEDGYDYEEPATTRKWPKIAAALVGAIVVGGGLTFAYQSLLGGSSDRPTPIVKSAEGPSKVKPSEPGGKQFANTDSKLLGRLGEGGAAPDGETGTRKVQTLVVGRDGAIQPPSAEPSATPASIPGVSVPVPGMTLIDVPAPGETVPAAPKPQPIVVQPPAAPVEVAVNEPRPAPVVPRSINPVEESPAPVAERPKPTPKPTRTAAIPQDAATTPAPAAKPSGLGYVAVLASVPASGTSRITALQQYADLQQRYAGILQNKTPDVTEANLGEKGRFHRLVVGPPGSKDGANSVCSQLKTAGYTSCWVMAY